MMMSRAWLQMVFLLLLFVVAFPNTCSAFPIRSSSSPWKRVSLVPQREKHSSYYFSFDTNFPTTIIGLYNNHHCQHDEYNDEKAALSSESAVQQVEPRTRRLFVKNTVVVALFVTTGVVVWMGGCPLLMTQQVQPAYATYSAYSHREDDWKQRQASGEVQFTSAASLRSQLKEMVPQNDSGRLLFCPNGPTAAVSPLMENKCGDKLAMPSVYGRTEDTMGNSIPGFAGGFYSSGISQSISSSSSADTGGLPSYSQYTTSGE